MARWDLEAEHKVRAACSQFKLLLGSQTGGNLRILNRRQLAWDRLENLRRLAKLRNGIVEGERMLNLFW